MYYDFVAYPSPKWIFLIFIDSRLSHLNPTVQLCRARRWKGVSTKKRRNVSKWDECTWAKARLTRQSYLHARSTAVLVPCMNLSSSQSRKSLKQKKTRHFVSFLFCCWPADQLRGRNATDSQIPVASDAGPGFVDLFRDHHVITLVQRGPSSTDALFSSHLFIPSYSTHQIEKNRRSHPCIKTVRGATHKSHSIVFYVFSDHKLQLISHFNSLCISESVCFVPCEPVQSCWKPVRRETRYVDHRIIWWKAL